MRSPTIRQLDKIYETIYMIVALNTPDDIILHVDECQAEITGTQRLSYTQRLKLHKTYLKKLIKKTGFKQNRNKLEPKVYKETKLLAQDAEQLRAIANDIGKGIINFWMVILLA